MMPPGDSSVGVAINLATYKIAHRLVHVPHGFQALDIRSRAVQGVRHQGWQDCAAQV